MTPKLSLNRRRRLLSLFCAPACALALLPALHAEIAPEVLELGKGQFQACALCHGPDGMGVAAGEQLMAPALPESPYIKGEYAELLAAIVLKGIKKEDNKFLQVMLPLEAVLEDKDLAAVLTYVRHEYGSKEETITPEQVAGWRKKYADFQMLSRGELAGLEEDLKPKPQLITDLEYAVYKGENWKKIPDFTPLKAVATGKLEDGLLSLDMAKDIKGNVGIVFTGTLNMPKNGQIEFLLASDDGARLILDGETVMADDGIHPARPRSKKIPIEKGLHSFELRYFDGGGHRALSLVAQGKPTGIGSTVPLSSWVHTGAKSRTQPPPDPIVIAPENPGEAVMYRNFLDGANPRAIGVGYPDEVNLTWDADIMNLATIWRGPFMDASRHWTNRGQGNQPPMGYDVVSTANGLPIQQLDSMSEPWVPQSIAETLIDRDKTPEERTSMRSFNIGHPDYDFRGYRLDAKRYPTFLYSYQNLEVQDGFANAKVDGGPNQSSQALQRTIKIKGKPAANTYLRLADSGSLSLQDGWYDISGPVKMKVEGAETISRDVEGGKELLVKLSKDQEIQVTYWWPVQVIKGAPQPKN